MSHEQTGSTHRFPSETVLNHQTVELSTDYQLLSREENIHEHAVNAAVIAEITLPVDNGSGADKQLQLLDFGEDLPEQGVPIFYLPGAGYLRGAGFAKNRFALHGSNFTPDDHIFSFYGLPLGSKTTVGREPTNHPAQQLGLNDTVRPSKHNEANATLSRDHFTIEVDDDGKIILTDHSTNGIVVKGFPVETGSDVSS